MRLDEIETLEELANNWDEEPKRLTLSLIADWRSLQQQLQLALNDINDAAIIKHIADEIGRRKT